MLIQVGPKAPIVRILGGSEEYILPISLCSIGIYITGSYQDQTGPTRTNLTPSQSQEDRGQRRDS